MEISPLFSFHKLTEDGIKKSQYVAESFNNLLQELAAVCPEGREFSIVKTKLEEASFFAKKAVANSPSNQAK